MATQVTQSGGNTSTPSFRGYRWCFTINNHTKEELLNLLKELSTSEAYALQEEKGECGTPHIQGCVCYKWQKSFEQMKKILPRAHIEKCKQWNAATEYCMKDETRNGERHTKGIKLKVIIKDPLDGKTLKPFQQEIIDIIKTEPDDRTIWWFWDKNGNTGKTTLCKHLALKHEALILGGKCNDIKYGVTAWLTQHPDLRVLLLDFTRSIEEFISYEGIESVKNGIFFSGKYESAQTIYNCPHVICFANFEPQTSKLSQDRWKIRAIT